MTKFIYACILFFPIVSFAYTPKIQVNSCLKSCVTLEKAQTEGWQICLSLGHLNPSDTLSFSQSQIKGGIFYCLYTAPGITLVILSKNCPQPANQSKDS